MSDQPDPDIQLIDATLRKLAEHFDTVTIFVTRQEDDPVEKAEMSTMSISRGCGNWWARYGVIENWINKQKAKAALEAESEMEDE